MQQLLVSLGPEYGVIVDTIDSSSTTLNTEEILQKLREKEFQLETNESTMGEKR